MRCRTICSTATADARSCSRGRSKHHVRLPRAFGSAAWRRSMSTEKRVVECGSLQCEGLGPAHFECFVTSICSERGLTFQRLTVCFSCGRHIAWDYTSNKLVVDFDPLRPRPSS